MSERMSKSEFRRLENQNGPLSKCPETPVGKLATLVRHDTGERVQITDAGDVVGELCKWGRCYACDRHRYNNVIWKEPS